MIKRAVGKVRPRPYVHGCIRKQLSEALEEEEAFGGASILDPNCTFVVNLSSIIPLHHISRIC